MKRYRVTLTPEEVAVLESIVNKGRHAAQKRKRARALLKTHQGETDQQVSAASGLCIRAVEMLRQRFVEVGFEATLDGLPKKPRSVVIDGEAEAHLVAIACGEKPTGHRRWTLRLLRDRMVEMGYVESVSHETVRQVLKKTNLSLGSGGSGAFRPRPTPTS